MLEAEQPSAPEGGCLSLVGGLFLGFGAGIVIPLLIFGLATSILPSTGRVRFMVAEVFDLAILAAIGYYYLHDFGKSMFAAGLVIGISISFLLNVVCGIAMISSS